MYFLLLSSFSHKFLNLLNHEFIQIGQLAAGLDSQVNEQAPWGDDLIHVGAYLPDHYRVFSAIAPASASQCKNLHTETLIPRSLPEID